MPELIFDYYCLELYIFCYFDVYFYLVVVLTLSFAMILNYTKIIYELKKRGVPLSKKVIKLYQYPLILFITQIPCVNILYNFKHIGDNKYIIN